VARSEVPFDAFAGDPVVVSDQCVNAGFRGAGCTRCADICPVKAITIRPGATLLDPGTCMRCGACLPTCPTEAIGARSPDRRLHFALADVPRRSAVVIVCARDATASWSLPVLRHDRCLAALGAEELLDLAGEAERDLWLDDSACSTCDLGQLWTAIAVAVRDGNALRQTLGLGPLLHLTTDEAVPAAGARLTPAIESRGGAMSRRGVFRRLVDEVSERFTLHSAGTAPPRRRQRVLARLRAWRPPPVVTTATVSVAGFGHVTIDHDRCSACGLCARFCPTGSLTFLETANEHGDRAFSLATHPAACVACGLCTVACPDAALTLEPRVDPAALLADSTETLTTGLLTSCQICGVATAGSDGASARCFSCRRGVVSPVRDEVGLMADLLGRLPHG